MAAVPRCSRVSLFQVVLELFIQLFLVFLSFLPPRGMKIASIFESIVHQEGDVEDDELVASHVHFTHLFNTNDRNKKKVITLKTTTMSTMT